MSLNYGKGSSTSDLDGKIVGWIIGFVVVLVGVGIFFAAADYYGTIVWWNLRAAMFWIVPLLVLIVIIVGLLAWTGPDPSIPVGFGAIVVGVACVAGFFWYTVSLHEYQQARQYTASVQVAGDDPRTRDVDEDAIPKFGQRAPYPVAEAQARSNLGDNSGDIAGTNYLPENDRYATLVTRRGTYSGYNTVIEQSIPLTGRGVPTTKCDFSNLADARIGGYFGHNLGRQIAQEHRWWRFEDGDAYAACVSAENGGVKPIVIVPMTRQVGGLFTVTERFAGVTVYDGKTGEVTVVIDKNKIAELPGPAYPLHLAKLQRESSRALTGYADWWFNRAGWETTDENNTLDVNSGNTSEFVLNDGGHAAYVTLLTGRGSATSISAMSVLRPDNADTGLGQLTVYRVDPTGASTDALASRIQADYQDLPNWTLLKIMEITPLDGIKWVATIGNEQNVLYRVQGDWAIPAGSGGTCLYRADGSRIRCGPVVDQNGLGVGVDIGPAQPGNQTGAQSDAPSVVQPPVVVPDNIDSLSDEEVARLLERVSAESAERLTAAK